MDFNFGKIQEDFEARVGRFPARWRDGVAHKLIIIVDIVDFTKRTETEQKKIVSRLWNFILAHPVVHGQGDNVVVTGTGDGAMVAFERLPFIEALALAEQWIGAMKPHAGAAAENRAELRLAAHVGNFERLFVGPNNIQILGNGPNECARISSIGDAGDVIVSEEFVRAWLLESNRINPQPNSVYPYVHPPGGDPIEIVVKHGVSQYVRIYNYRDGSFRPPEKIARLNLVADLIRKAVLPDLYDDLLSLLREQSKRLRERAEVEAKNVERDVHARVSILAIDPERPRVLSSNNYRHAFDPRLAVKGRVCYPLGSTPGSVLNPAGRSYDGRSVAVLHKLPYVPPEGTEGRQQALAAYCEAFGMPVTELQHMQRFARSFICFPFSLNPHPGTGEAIAGVICIDCMDPLDDLERQQLIDVGIALKVDYAMLIASLWLNRL